MNEFPLFPASQSLLITAQVHNTESQPFSDVTSGHITNHPKWATFSSPQQRDVSPRDKCTEPTEQLSAVVPGRQMLAHMFSQLWLGYHRR